MTARYEIRVATSADAPGIRRLFARVFGKEMSQEEWEWKYLANPDGWFGIVAVVGGEIVGNYAGWGMRFRLDGRERLTYAVGDVATLPAVRLLGGRRGVYRSMTEAFYETVRASGVPFCFGFPGDRHLEVSNRIVGSRALLPVREVHVPCETFPESPPDFLAGDFVAEPFDSLWESASRYLSHAAVRDRSRVNWRFHARPTRYYRMVSRPESGEIRSWAVLSIMGESATVVDFLGTRPYGSDLVPLFSAAAAEASLHGARRLIFWETPGGPAADIIRALPGDRRDAGFRVLVRAFDDGAADRFGRNVHLVPALYDMI